jgi:hypothetical protein
LYGGDGNDTLDGDSGYDELYGEAGNDKLYGANLFGTWFGGDDVSGGSGSNTKYYRGMEDRYSQLDILLLGLVIQKLNFTGSVTTTSAPTYVSSTYKPTWLNIGTLNQAMSLTTVTNNLHDYYSSGAWLARLDPELRNAQIEFEKTGRGGRTLNYDKLSDAFTQQTRSTQFYGGMLDRNTATSLYDI